MHDVGVKVPVFRFPQSGRIFISESAANPHVAGTIPNFGYLRQLRVDGREKLMGNPKFIFRPEALTMISTHRIRRMLPGHEFRDVKSSLANLRHLRIGRQVKGEH